MKKSLYNLTADQQHLLQLLEDEVDENNIQNLFARFDETEKEINTKLENYYYIIQENEAFIGMYKKEIERLNDKSKALKNLNERMKNRIKEHMQALDRQAIKTDKVNISIQKSPLSVEIVSEIDIPHEFFDIIPSTIKLSKKLILNHYKETNNTPKGTLIKKSEHIRFR